MSLPKLWIQEIPAYFHLVWFVGESATNVLAGKSPIHFSRIYAVFKNNFLSWCYEEDDLMRIGKYIEEHFDEFPKIIENWRNDELKSFYDVIRNMSYDIDNYKSFMKAYLEEYSLPLLADAVSFYCEREIIRYIKGPKELSKLTTPTKLSFLAREKNELYEIIEKKKKGLDIDEDLKKHRDRWYFIMNNYFNTYDLSVDYFKKRIKEHGNNYSFIKPVSKDLSRYPPRVRKLANMSDLFTMWQDERKQANLIANFHLMKFLDNFEKETGNKYLYYTTPRELFAILDGNDIKGLDKRKNYSAIIFPGKPLSFEDSYKLYNEIHPLTDYANIDDIYGTVANVGKVIGRAKVVLTPDDFEKVLKGDIIITTMTRPEFMPVLNKVKGIIADEGGLSSHAAIISRELDIPCILGTKIATKVIKDNYLIELNADHGIIRILEKS